MKKHPVNLKFGMVHLVEPEDLIILSVEYKTHAVYLLEDLRGKVGQIVEINLMRFNPYGQHKTNMCTGKIIKVGPVSFEMEVCSCGGISFEEPVKKLVHIDNPLGEVPLLKWGDYINPFTVNSNEKTSRYLRKLHEMKELLKTCVGEKSKKVVLFYNFSKDEPVFRNGNYHVEGLVQAVNLSNVEIGHLATRSKHNEKIIVDLASGKRVLRYMMSNAYLWMVQVQDNCFQTSRFDDQYESSEEKTHTAKDLIEI